VGISGGYVGAVAFCFAFWQLQATKRQSLSWVLPFWDRLYFHYCFIVIEGSWQCDLSKLGKMTKRHHMQKTSLCHFAGTRIFLNPS
jgi:hypothetical protein